MVNLNAAILKLNAAMVELNAAIVKIHFAMLQLNVSALAKDSRNKSKRDHCEAQLRDFRTKRQRTKCT